jgi:hypothetical protein
LKGKQSNNFENILDHKKVEGQICSATVFCTAPLDFARVQQPKIISQCAGRDSGVPARRISARPSSPTTTTTTILHPNCFFSQQPSRCPLLRSSSKTRSNSPAAHCSAIRRAHAQPLPVKLRLSFGSHPPLESLHPRTLASNTKQRFAHNTALDYRRNTRLRRPRNIVNLSPR